MMIFPCLVLQCLLGLIMFGGEFLTSFVQEAGVQERMKNMGEQMKNMGEIHYGKSSMKNILYI